LVQHTIHERGVTAQSLQWGALERFHPWVETLSLIPVLASNFIGLRSLRTSDQADIAVADQRGVAVCGSASSVRFVRVCSRG
jgi:hypothetical protein